MKRSHTCLSIVSLATSDLGGPMVLVNGSGGTRPDCRQLAQPGGKLAGMTGSFPSPGTQRHVKIARSESVPIFAVFGSNSAPPPTWRLGPSLLAQSAPKVPVVGPVLMREAPEESDTDDFRTISPLSFDLPPEYAVNSDDVLSEPADENAFLSSSDEYEGYFIGPSPVNEVEHLVLPPAVTCLAPGRFSSCAGSVYAQAQNPQVPKSKRLIKIVQFAAENGLDRNLNTILRLSDVAERDIPPPPLFFNLCSPTTSCVGMKFGPPRSHNIIEIKIPAREEIGLKRGSRWQKV